MALVEVQDVQFTKTDPAIYVIGKITFTWLMVLCQLNSLYVSIACKQWLFRTGTDHFVFWYHNGMADPGTSVEPADMPGSALWLWHQYSKCAVSIGSNHCFQTIGTYNNWSTNIYGDVMSYRLSISDSVSTLNNGSEFGIAINSILSFDVNVCHIKKKFGE